MSKELNDRIWHALSDRSVQHERDLALGYLRYEALRKLNPKEFDQLWRDAIVSDKSFDSLVDELIEGVRKLPQ